MPLYLRKWWLSTQIYNLFMDLFGVSVFRPHRNPVSTFQLAETWCVSLVFTCWISASSPEWPSHHLTAAAPSETCLEGDCGLQNNTEHKQKHIWMKALKEKIHLIMMLMISPRSVLSPSSPEETFPECLPSLLGRELTKTGLIWISVNIYTVSKRLWW